MDKNKAQKGTMITYSSIIYKEKDAYVAWSPEFDIACQGETIEDATKDLEVSIKLYMSHPQSKIPTIDFVAVASRVMKLEDITKEKEDSEALFSFS